MIFRATRSQTHFPHCRQLPLLAAMLTGRCQFSFDEFRHRNHHLLFTHALGLLELLQPHVFHSQHREPFALCLQTYFEFIQVRDLPSAAKLLCPNGVACVRVFVCVDVCANESCDGL